jgi:hypothetical protein
MITKLQIENTYSSLVEDYASIMLDEMLSSSELGFEELDREEQSDKYDLLANFEWKDFIEENTRLYLTPTDIQLLKIIVTASSHFEYAFNNKHSKSQYKNFAIDIFKRDCYLLAILKYTVAFNEEFKTPKFLKDTEDYLNDVNLINEEFFKGL